MNKNIKDSQRLTLFVWVKSLAVAALLACAGFANADYLGTDNLRIFPIPLDDIVDGYDVGDRIQFVIEVTPADTGSDEGNAAWSTFYIPRGAKVVAANYVTIGGGGDYVLAPADDVDDTYDGWGARGDPGYDTGLDQGFVNEVQQDTGIFYSTDARTEQNFQPGSDVIGFDTVDGTGVAETQVFNIWDRDQTVAFGEGGALSGNGGKGNTPIVLGSPNKGTGSPVAGPDTYYTNEYNPSLGGSFANQLSGVGPWQRIDTLGDKIGGSGPVTPAIETGAITNTSVPATGGFVFTGSNNLPLATNAVRIVHGARRLGDLERWSITLELTDEVPGEGVTEFLDDLDSGRVCADSIPGDTTPAKDNNWRYYEVSRSCADLNSTAAIVKEITKPASASAVQSGDVINYSFTIYNLSNTTLMNVSPRDDAISELTLVSAATAGCDYANYNGMISNPPATVNLTSQNGAAATWSSFNLQAGESATFTICGTADGAFSDIVRNRASATYTGCTAPCLVSDAIIPVTNRVSGTVYADVDASGTLTGSEVGIPGVTVSLYRDDNGNGIYDPGTDVLVSQTLTAGDGSYEFVAIPSDDYIIVETNLPFYTSTGDVDNTTTNCGAGNGCDTIGSGGDGTSVSITVTPSTELLDRNFFDLPPFPDLQIIKTAAPQPVRRGQNLVYTLEVTNSASSVIEATSVVVSDPLPAGLTWISTQNSTAGGTCTATPEVLGVCGCSLPGLLGTLTCQMGTLAIGQTETVTITTTVD